MFPKFVPSSAISAPSAGAPSLGCLQSGCAVDADHQDPRSFAPLGIAGTAQRSIPTASPPFPLPNRQHNSFPRRVAEEIFDVVNERDEVIGQAPRREVHRLNLRHRAVHVLLFNRLGEVFLQQRSLAKDNWPGVWDSSSSGHLDSGEDYDACCLREIGEELGVTLATVPPRVLKLEATPETGWEFCWVYRAEHEGPFILQPSEVRGGAWFAPDAVNEWIARRPQDFASAFLILWRRLAP